MSATAEPVLAPGTRLAHYEIEGQIGAGAMGTVYRAHDTALDRSVAVKVLRARLAGEPALVDRFVREARAAARVNHPNLTHIYFVGAEHGAQFFAMEFVPGTTLEHEVATNGPMSLARFVEVITQAARGLSAAHGAGVVHRDVKPSNLMLLPDGTVKVTDFGLAKSLDGNVDASGGGLLLGTPTYMSPEQCRGRGVDVRTDVYALGLVAWYLLAGKPPFAAESLGQMIHDQMNTPLPSIRALRPELPPGLDRALGELCEKDPEKRPKSMEEVAALFEQFRPRVLDPATFAARAFAFGVDITLVQIAWGIAAMGLKLLESHLGEDLVSYLQAASFAGALFAVQYVFEALLGTTFGKWLFNLEVVREDGATPTRRALLLRFLVRYPFAPFLLWPGIPTWAGITALVLGSLALVLSFATFFAWKRRTLSDLLTKTRVVYRGGAHKR
jgi:tRNA A-37 threonylcarbamoyl transferase component Bud32/uncharacterized RDD family membrane protein YckC